MAISFCLAFLQLRVVLDPRPVFQVRVCRRRFLSNDFEGLAPHVTRNDDRIPPKHPFCTSSVRLPSLPNRSGVSFDSEYRGVSASWVRKEDRRLCPEGVEMAALRQEPREVLCIRYNLRQSGR